MRHSPDFILPLLDYWRGLREGTRDNIIGGLVVALIIGVLVTFRKALLSGLRRLFGGSQLATSHHELTIKVDSSQQPPTKAPIDFVPPTTGVKYLPNIPREPSAGFVARRDEEGHDIVELLKRDLSPAKNSLIVLWGEGGIGKTTLAAEAAHSLIDVYSSRTLWTSAEKRADFTYSTFLDEIAIGLNQKDLLRLAIGPKEMEIQTLLAESPALVVLDNFETIAPEQGKLCSGFLLHKATSAALITTREQIAGARNIRIDAMSLDEAGELLKRLIVQSASPEAFANLDHDRLMKTAARNPLVMEWIVAQIALAQRPEDVLEDLAQGKGDAAQRVFDRSFNLPQLGEDGRAVLLALSLFVPSASREALAAVAGLSDKGRFDDAVKHLAAMRLIRSLNGGERLVVQGLTRELARARLTQNNSRIIQERFVDYFRLPSSQVTGLEEAYDAIETEKDNALVALDLAFEMQHWMKVIELAKRLNNFGTGMLFLRGYWDDAIRCQTTALKAAKLADSTWHVGALANALGTIHYERGNYDLTKDYLTSAADTARKLENKQALAATLHALANLARRQSDFKEAERLYNDSLNIEREIANDDGIGMTLTELGSLALLEGKFERAREHYSEALAIFDRTGDKRHSVTVEYQLGMLAEAQGDFTEAQSRYNNSLQFYEKLKYQKGIAFSLHRIGLLAEKRGNLNEASVLISRALTILVNLNSKNVDSARKDLNRIMQKLS